MKKTTVDLIGMSEMELIRAFFPDVEVEVVRAEKAHDSIVREEATV